MLPSFEFRGLLKYDSVFAAFQNLASYIRFKYLGIALIIFTFFFPY